MLHIDGSQGEGGGQMLRTALGLAVATGRPFEMTRIRAGRDRPGLLRQHLAAVRLLSALGDAEVSGGELGSTALRFTPRARPAGDYSVAIGSAGSALLVFQAALPALLRARGPFRVVIDGGTHNSGAPPFEHTALVLVPALRHLGASISVTLERHGFYPAGGGRIVIEGAPAALGPLELLDRGPLQRLEGQALVSGLSTKIGKRELGVVREVLLGHFPDGANLRELLQVVEVPKPVGPGNALSVIARCEHVTEVFTSFGERGVAAETVASEAADTARTWLDSGTPVAAHTADQLLVPMAVAGGGVFQTTPLSLHTRTNMDVIARFGGVRFDVQSEAGGFGWRVTVRCQGSSESRETD
ncbi:MAG: RNA 3'-terminal phosphate cyclase [Myxococcales bacterium]|nr:RNA 3'-terminal phosphate cyclase [Myxococcales bacterium]